MNSSENNLSGVSTESVEPRHTSDLPEGPRTGADGSGVSAPAQPNFPVPVLAEPQSETQHTERDHGEARESNPTSPPQKGGGVLRRGKFQSEAFYVDDVVMHPRGDLDVLRQPTPRYKFTHGKGHRKFIKVTTIDKISGKAIWNVIEIK